MSEPNDLPPEIDNRDKRVMTGKFDWTKAHQAKAWNPTYKEKRLEQAADNWLDHGSLYKKPTPKPTKAKKWKA